MMNKKNQKKVFLILRVGIAEVFEEAYQECQDQGAPFGLIEDMAMHVLIDILSALLASTNHTLIESTLDKLYKDIRNNVKEKIESPQFKQGKGK